MLPRLQRPAPTPRLDFHSRTSLLESNISFFGLGTSSLRGGLLPDFFCSVSLESGEVASIPTLAGVEGSGFKGLYRFFRYSRWESDDSTQWNSTFWSKNWRQEVARDRSSLELAPESSGEPERLFFFFWRERSLLSFSFTSIESWRGHSGRTKPQLLRSKEKRRRRRRDNHTQTENIHVQKNPFLLQ